MRPANLPIHNDRTQLLLKCLYGKMQNANECFNGMIWQRISKIYYVGLGNLNYHQSVSTVKQKMQMNEYIMLDIL